MIFLVPKLIIVLCKKMESHNNIVSIAPINDNNKNFSNTNRLKNLTKFKMSDLIIAKILNFAKINSFKTDFLIAEVKKIFIHCKKQVN